MLIIKYRYALYHCLKTTTTTKKQKPERNLVPLLGARTHVTMFCYISLAYNFPPVTGSHQSPCLLLGKFMF